MALGCARATGGPAIARVPVGRRSRRANPPTQRGHTFRHVRESSYYIRRAADAAGGGAGRRGAARRERDGTRTRNKIVCGAGKESPGGV